MKKTLFALVTFLVCSCGVGSGLKQMLEIGSKIAAELGANSCQIGYSTNTSTAHGTSKQVTITLDGLGEKQQKQPRDKIASVAVMMYYQSLDPKEKIKYEDTKVEINIGADRFEKVFNKSEIERTFRLLKLVNRFFEMVNNNDFSGHKEVIDTAYISDSTVVMIQNTFSKINSEEGKFNTVLITGFGADRVKASGAPVTRFWVETRNEKAINFYNLYFLDESEKLVHLGINEDRAK